MRIPMPRLVKDSKTAIWFFRWSLPKHLQQTLDHVRWENKRIARCRHFHVVDVSKHPTCTAAKQKMWVVQAEHA